MNFNEYQHEARKTAIYPDVGNNFWYPALGLSGEAGEVAEIVKKLYRDNGGKLDSDRRIALGVELGDILWYIANLASEADINLESIAFNNIVKLKDRHVRGKVQGSGNNR